MSLTAIIGNERCIMRVWVLVHCTLQGPTTKGRDSK